MRILIFILSIFLGLQGIVFALTPLSSNELEKVVASAGVDLTIDDVTLYQHFNNISFLDLDGGDNSHNPFGYSFIADSGPANLNMKNIKVDVLKINSLIPTSDVVGEIDTYFDLSMSQAMDQFTPSPLSIDVVDEIPVLSIGYNYMLSAKYGGLLGLPDPDGEDYNKIGIVIGLPTLDIYANEITIDKISVTPSLRNSINQDASFGGISMEGFDLALLSGLMEISPHQYSGFDLAVDDVVLFAQINKLSFIDNDGLNDNIKTSLCLENVKVDTLQINALTHTDFDILDVLNPQQAKIKSPGKYDAHLENLDHYTKIFILGDRLKSFHGQPLFINVSRELPDTSKVMLANGGSGVIGGVFIALGTLELFMEKFSIEKIYVNDSTNMAINNGASFFGIEAKGVNLSVLNGAVEISTH